MTSHVASSAPTADVEKSAGTTRNRPAPEEVEAGSYGEDAIVRTLSTTSAPIDDPPDGGWLAWSQLIPGHLTTALTWGYGAGFSVFQLYYVQTYGWSSSQVSWIGSIQLFFYFLMGLVSGRMADAGYTKQLYLAGSALSIFGFMMTSISTQYWQFLLAQGFCNGIGGGIMFVPVIANVGSYFKKKRTLAMAINACGTSTGAILFPALIQNLIPKLGFGWTVRLCGFIALAFQIVGFTLLKPRQVAKRKAPIIDIGLFRDVPRAMYGAGSFLTYFAIFSALIYINSYARQVIGISDLEAINFVLATNALALVSRPIFGYIADKYAGAVNVCGLGSISVGIIIFGWSGVHTRAGMYTFSCLLGFVYGAAQGVMPGATSSLITDTRKLGTWVGMLFTICGFATLAGPPILGAIIDASGGGYIWAQIWAGLVSVLGGGLIVLSAWLKAGWKQGRIFVKA